MRNDIQAWGKIGFMDKFTKAGGAKITFRRLRFFRVVKNLAGSYSLSYSKLLNI